MTMTPAVHAAPGAAQGTPLLDFSSFTEIASSAFVPLSIRSSKKGAFRGRLRTAEVDRLAFTELFATAHEVERTPRLISQGGDYYMVGIMVAGSGILIQDGRELVLREGDITIYDTARPFSLNFEDESRNFVIMLPKNTLSLPQELIGELTATRLPSDSHTGALASQFLLQVPQALQSSFREVNLGLARTSTELIETLLTMALGADRLTQNPHQALLRKVREYIDENLGSAELHPGQIALAHHVSTRHLYDLFRSQGTTVSAYIRTQRLERCRRDLMNPALTDRTVSAIAARWGFIDAAHFSRAFRAHFNISPREARAGL